MGIPLDACAGTFDFGTNKCAIPGESFYELFVFSSIKQISYTE